MCESRKAGLSPASDSLRGREPNSLLAQGRPGSHIAHPMQRVGVEAMWISLGGSPQW